MTSRSFSYPPPAGRWRIADVLGDRIEQAVGEALLALVVEGVGDIEIFVDDGRHRHVGPGDQLIGPGEQQRAHRPVEPLEAPALAEPGGDQRIELGAAGVDAADDVVEEALLGLGIGGVLDRRSEPVLVELVEQAGQRRAFHLHLVERLDGGEPGGGAGERAGGHGLRAL